MKTEDIKKLAQILSDMREASLKGNQHKLDVDKDGDIEADDLAKLRAKKDKKEVDEVVTKYTTGGRKLNWQAKKAIKKLSDKEVDEVKYVPGFVGADGKATSKPTAKDYAANKEYQSMKKRLGDRIPGPKPTKEEVELDEMKKGDWVVHPKTGHVGQVTNVSGDKEIADVKWNKTGMQTSHPKGSLQKMKEEVELDEALYKVPSNYSVLAKRAKKNRDAKEKAAAILRQKSDSIKKKNEEVEFKEGTWALPNSPKAKAELKKLMSKPIKLGKEGDDAADKLSAFIGDDELFDDLYVAGKKNPNGDARDVVKKHMKRLGIKEEVELADEVSAYGRFHMESIRASIQKMWEANTGNSQSPHAGSEETKDSKEKQLKRSAGEKAFVDAHKVNTVDGAKDASDSIEKANASNKVAPKRKNDNKQGDMKIMNKPEDITAKGKG